MRSCRAAQRAKQTEVPPARVSGIEIYNEVRNGSNANYKMAPMYVKPKAEIDSHPDEYI